MSDDDPLFVDCEKHGRGVAAIVCRHLCNEQESPIGFIENSSEPGDKQAWCHKCEKYFVEEGEMTDAFKAFNDMAIVCETCYAEAKSKHRFPG